MSKVYGWFVSDRTKESTKGGNQWIESTLQTVEVRTITQVTAEGNTIIRTYQMHGQNNQGGLLRQIVMDKTGKVIMNSEGEAFQRMHEVA